MPKGLLTLPRPERRSSLVNGIVSLTGPFGVFGYLASGSIGRSMEASVPELNTWA